MECRKCHIQYIGKTETPFNQRLNHHQAMITGQNQTPACKQFNGKDHDFNRDAKFTLIEENYCREINNHSPERKLLDNHTANTDPSRF